MRGLFGYPNHSNKINRNIIGISKNNEVLLLNAVFGNTDVTTVNVISANTPITFIIENEELIFGDKTYKINIYGKNENGVWSQYE